MCFVFPSIRSVMFSSIIIIVYNILYGHIIALLAWHNYHITDALYHWHVLLLFHRSIAPLLTYNYALLLHFCLSILLTYVLSYWYKSFCLTTLHITLCTLYCRLSFDLLTYYLTVLLSWLTRCYTAWLKYCLMSTHCLSVVLTCNLLQMLHWHNCFSVIA